MTTDNNFSPIEFFRKEDGQYRFLPFRFKRLGNQVFLSNLIGDSLILDKEEFADFTKKRLSKVSPKYAILRARHFLADDNKTHEDLLSSELWTKKSFIQGFTKLHIFVLTVRCNSACVYCQASRQDACSSRSYDMPIETARKHVELMMHSPSPDITVEFQGGEPFLNFDALKEIVLYSEELNKPKNKNLTYVACTNLSLWDNEKIDFCKAHNIQISTSLDGPRDLHNLNRARSNKSAAYDVVVKNIHLAQEALGISSVSALMTTTKDSLKYPTEIVDEYLKNNLGSIFIRALNPYGYAVKTEKSIGYSMEEFIDFYKKSLNYIIHVNKNIQQFPEGYSTLILKKMLTPWPIGFVDLQSPTGNGFSVTVYNYDGDIYASDESRMLYEMGDPMFRLGNAFENTYEEIYLGDAMQLIASVGVAEGLAGCSDCAYVPYCGADPIRHYATQNDAYGNRASSSFCKKNMGIFDYLISLLSGADAETERILWSWIRNCSLSELDFDKVEIDHASC